jgi:hypothetical protein
MVNNVGIHFYFSAFLFLFFSSMSMFVWFFFLFHSHGMHSAHTVLLSLRCAGGYLIFLDGAWVYFFYFLSCFHYLGGSFYSKECCIAISFTSLIGLCVD